MNRTLNDMMAKYAALHGSEWDKYLPYLLFAYGVKPHCSTNESPFFLLYGSDVRLPRETALEKMLSLGQIEADGYKTDLLLSFSTAWENAQLRVG